MTVFFLLKLPHVVKEGFIHKEERRITKVMQRYFFKLIIDVDCHPVLEYFDTTLHRLGLCNLSACTMNKPKNMRPPFMHCLRIDLIEHDMNSFTKLVLGWETQADHDDWVKAFRTASTLITARRSASLGVQTSNDMQDSPVLETKIDIPEPQHGEGLQNGKIDVSLLETKIDIPEPQHGEGWQNGKIDVPLHEEVELGYCDRCVNVTKTCFLGFAHGLLFCLKCFFVCLGNFLWALLYCTIGCCYGCSRGARIKDDDFKCLEECFGKDFPFSV